MDGRLMYMVMFLLVPISQFNVHNSTYNNQVLKPWIHQNSHFVISTMFVKVDTAWSFFKQNFAYLQITHVMTVNKKLIVLALMK